MKRNASLNLIASEKLAGLEYRKMRDSALRTLMMLAVCLLIVIGVETGMYAYQATVRLSEVPAALAAEHETKQAGHAALRQQIAQIAVAEQEKKPLTQMVREIVLKKPPDIMFNTMELTAEGLTINCFGKNPENFHGYAQELNTQSTFFQGVKVEKITTIQSAQDYKSAAMKLEFRQ